MKRVFNILLLFISVVIYSSVLIAPDKFWPAGFIGYMIPAVLIFGMVVFLWRLQKFSLGAIFPFIILVLGWQFIIHSVSFHKSSENGDIDILSFNTKVFNIYNNNGRDTASVKRMTEWIKDQNADIFCFQEFYNHSQSGHFNTLKNISGREYHYFFNPVITNSIGAEFGTVIFSKYPIVNQGVIDFSDESNNNVIFVDILIQDDTIRVYNMHLQSMHISEEEMINSDDFQAGFKNLATRLKFGFINRSQQIKKLMKHISENSLPVIVCGDLNDLPYSYVYHQISKDLNNAFEKAGNGFGFTFNGKLFFLRIDHQFYSQEFRIHSFETKRDMKLSDHFPITASYSLIDNPEKQ